MFAASEKGDLETVVNLIGRRTSVNIQNERGYTPLQLAAKGCKFAVAESLFLAGSLSKNLSPEGKTLLQTVLDSDAPVGDKASMLSTMTDHYGTIEEKQYMYGLAYSYAIEANNILLAKHMLGECNNMNVKTPKDGITPLIATCAANRGMFVDRILKKHADPNVADNSGRTPLILSIENGADDVVEMLLKANVKMIKLPKDPRALASKLLSEHPDPKRARIVNLLANVH